MSKAKCPVITLNNGLRIANWSSPHPFVFTTGEILPKCDDDRVMVLNLEVTETILDDKDWDDIEIHYDIPKNVQEDLLLLQGDKGIDIILVPFMVMDILKKKNIFKYVDKCRVIRLADRIKKIIHPNKFCV